MAIKSASGYSYDIIKVFYKKINKNRFRIYRRTHKKIRERRIGVGNVHYAIRGRSVPQTAVIYGYLRDWRGDRGNKGYNLTWL